MYSESYKSLFYDIKNQQENLNVHPSRLLQEMATRWWSILTMLTSIEKNNDDNTHTLQKLKKVHLFLAMKS